MSESGHETNRVSHGPVDPAGLNIPPEPAATRQTIDNIDAALVHIPVECFRYAQCAGHTKALNELPSADSAREARQIARLQALTEQSGLSSDSAQKFLVFMIVEVIRHHEDIKAEYESGE